MMSTAKNSLLIELTTDSDDERPVYISGTFCNWNPQLPEFQMTRVARGKYQYRFPASFRFEQTLEYKYTRGGWDQVELTAQGEASKNRKLRPRTATKRDFVPHWRRNGLAFDERKMPLVETVSDAFLMPQLERSRRIRILLPHDYHQNPTKTYPVLYMQDAQNLFGQGSNYGNWEIDKKMAIMAAQGKGEFLVVAIDHGDSERINEFTPYANPKLGKGVGKKYANFIVRTLKPHIDAQYRTKPERQFTGIGGSSMGGLISIYAGMMYPETLGRLLVFSPSLWVSSKIYFDAIEFFNPEDTKIYAYAGGKESRYMVPSVERLKEAIQRQGWDASRLQFMLSTDPQGQHNEARWGKEFPKAVSWLFME
jgi:predicted alpha/beta superfamily hydrolase